MSKQYQMSMIGEMTYFHGLQVHHKSVDIFIKQSKYVHDLLKKYSFEHCSSMSTPMNVFDKFHKDEFGKPMCQTTYRGMIGSLLYLTASRPDIMFSTCLCTRYQADPKESHIKANACLMHSQTFINLLKNNYMHSQHTSLHTIEDTYK